MFKSKILCLKMILKLQTLEQCITCPVQIRLDQSLSRIQLFATHESQHTRPPCPSPTPGVHSDSCPSSQWCHPAISSSVIPFSSCPQSLPASESFPMSQLFTWGGPEYWSFSFSIIPSKEIPGLNYLSNSVVFILIIIIMIEAKK